MVVLKNPVRFGTRLVDGTLNPAGDKAHAEFLISDAPHPAYVEIAYAPGPHRTDHKREYRVWVPTGDFYQLTPDE